MDSEKEASEVIYRVNIFSTIKISCFSQVIYLSLAWLSSFILCRNEVATEIINEKVWIFVIHMPNMQCFQQMFLLLLNAFMFLVFSFWSEHFFLNSWEINFYEINYEAKYVNSVTEDDIVTGIYVCWEITFPFPEKTYSDFWKQETERTNIILTTCS